MAIQVISNETEYSVSIARSDGTNLELCAFKDDKSLVLAISHIESDDSYQSIFLSANEASVLFSHFRGLGE